MVNETPVDSSAVRLRGPGSKVKRPISTPNLHRHKTPKIKLETYIQPAEHQWRCRSPADKLELYRLRTLEPEFTSPGLYSIDEILQMEQAQTKALLSRQIVKMRSEADLSLVRDSKYVV